MVLMHMNGEPKTMQEAPEYDDVVAEVASSWASLMAARTRAARSYRATLRGWRDVWKMRGPGGVGATVSTLKSP